MITGINHTTLAVRDLQRALAFYTEILGLRPLVRWEGGAYLLAGEAWLCLSVDAQARAAPHPDYTHLAFSVSQEAFSALGAALRAAGARIWKDNRSEGDSLYFLDPDGHKLELHVGDLASRLRALREQPYAGLQWFD